MVVMEQLRCCVGCMSTPHNMIYTGVERKKGEEEEISEGKKGKRVKEKKKYIIRGKNK